MFSESEACPHSIQGYDSAHTTEGEVNEFVWSCCFHQQLVNLSLQQQEV